MRMCRTNLDIRTQFTFTFVNAQRDKHKSMQTDFVCSGHLLDWLHPPAAHIGFAFSFDAIALFYQTLSAYCHRTRTRSILLLKKYLKFTLH